MPRRLRALRSLIPSSILAVALAVPALAKTGGELSPPPAEAEPSPPRQPQPSGPPREADRPAPPAKPAPAAPPARLDLGVTGGFNNPGGVFGATTDFRVIHFLSVGMDLGFGGWGLRTTPHARVYPFGVGHLSPFVEGDLSLNFGGPVKTNVISGPSSSSITIIEEIEPVAAVLLGLRGWWARHFFAEGHLGWGFNLNQGAYHSADGRPIDDPIVNASYASAEPGGFIFGASVGFSFL